MASRGEVLALPPPHYQPLALQLPGQGGEVLAGDEPHILWKGSKSTTQGRGG